MNDTDPKPVPVKSIVAQNEEKILEFWNENSIFKKTLEKESPKGEFVFYEGPPTANAAPALHHLEARAFKDIIPRYRTMRGYHVRRKGGWDTHGLPVELQIEKKLGLKSKKEIEKYGVAEFNRACRESVWEYMELWHKFTDRIGYWVDNDNAYVTYHNSYIESLWNIVGHIEKRKLLYKDYKVVPWCPRCGTALSSHELAQGYDEITDLSLYVKFKLSPNQKFGESGEYVTGENAYIIAWTTTPWTLPGNVGLAVSKDISYSAVRIDGTNELLIVGTDLVSKVLEGHAVEVVHQFTGAGLLGLSYEPLYPYLKNLATGEAKEKLPNAWKVYPADFVTTTDGTGVVHTAVMYGQEDFDLGTQVGMPKFHLVSPDGVFIPGTDFLEGKYVRSEETTVDIVKNLAHRGLLFKKEKHKHSYPHCWRCKTALIYYARDSWYVRMSELKDDLQKENEKINWEPTHIKEGRFGEWIREIKDWAISRERYWGTPLPIWETESGERYIIDSIAELKNRIGRKNNFFLMRHGQSEDNVKGNLINCTDRNINPLTEAGIQNVKESVKKFIDQGKKIDVIIASPFLRTRTSAEIVADALGVDKSKIVIDERLHEIYVDGFDGKSWEEFTAQFTSMKDRFERSIDGSESWGQVTTRVMECMYSINEQYEGKNILIVGHGGPLNLIGLASQGLSLEDIMKQYSNDGVKNGEINACDFVALPHNEKFETDLHRPYIDDVVCVSPDGKPMKRVKEVMDVWFDSGAMPFAQDHYPFENKEWVEGPGYPADFISEAIDQTRGWFYTLLAVGVLMKKGTPYKNVICLGHILDKNGKKMSKSIGNIVNPWNLMDTYGVDALRLWMYSVNQPGDSKNFDEKTVDEIVKKVFNPLSNIYTLFALYSENVTRVNPLESKNVLDEWILARLHTTVSLTTTYLDNFKLYEPVKLLRDFIQDFSTWYIRRSRDRFKSSDMSLRSEVVSVTEYALLELSKCMAPFTPFFAEKLYLDITKGKQKESVHLESWPEKVTVSTDLIEKMQQVRETVTSALELRQKAGIKVRQPLAELKISQPFDQDLLDIIADEINVKKVSVSEDGTLSLDTTLTVELKEEGIARDIIRGIQDARKNENLNPEDTVDLTVSSSLEITTIFKKYADMIQKPTGVKTVVFANDKQKHVVSLEGGEITVTISK